MSEKANDEQRSETGDDHAKGDYVEVIDLDEFDAAEDGDFAAEDDWVPDEELSLHEVGPEEAGPSFIAIDGVTTVEPQLTFTRHTGSVFRVATDGVSGKYTISGGEDDRAFVWLTETGEVCFVCEGHKDSVIEVGISHDALYAFSADMSGVVKVWHLSDGSEVWTTETSDLKWTRWHPKAHVLFAGTDDGTFFMWHIPLGQCKVLQMSGSLSAHEFFPEGKRICIAHGNAVISVIDLKQWSVSHTFSGRRGPEDEILTVDVSPDGALVASGSMNGAIRLFNAQTGKSVWDIDENVFSTGNKEDRAIETVSFSKTHSWLNVAGLNGTFCVYDIPTQTKRHSDYRRELGGITKLVSIPKTENFLLAHVTGVASLWDGRDGTLYKVFYGKQDEVLDTVVSQDGRRVLVASNDGSVSVFTMNQ